MDELKKGDNMLEEINREIEKYKRMLRIIDTFKSREPKGYLKRQERNGKVFYYHVVANPTTGIVEKKYIRQKDLDRVRRLAQKHYYLHIRPVIERNLHVLERFAERYDFDGVDLVYQKMSPHYRELITPLPGSKEEILKKWNEQNEDDEAPYPEYRRFRTEQGEFVRSKSEVIIANALYAHRDVLVYKYEKPLCVTENGKKKLIHPDFTILNLVTGKIKYWEHAGILDAGRYADDFVNREKTYMDNRILPGEQLIHSYETSNISLNIATINKIIETQLL